MDGKYTCFVWENDKPVLREFKVGSRPSNFCMVAPPGLREGDDDLVTIDNGVKVDEAGLQKRNEARQWNNATVIERIKGKIFG